MNIRERGIWLKYIVLCSCRKVRCPKTGKMERKKSGIIFSLTNFSYFCGVFHTNLLLACKSYSLGKYRLEAFCSCKRVEI